MSAGALEFLTTGDDDGRRLDQALAVRAEVGSRAAAERLIEQGHVLVDGRPQRKRHRLSAGERVVVRLEPRLPAPGDVAAGEGVPYSVAFEDEHVIVVDKPAGVVVHPAPGHPTGTLAQALAGRAAGGTEPWRPGIVHRLDRDTSGLLVVAKSDAVHRRLQDALRERTVAREYLALVEGRPPTATGTVEAAIGRDRADPTLVSLRTDRPRAARTHFAVEEALAGASLLRVHLDTGRTHQVRVHLASIGHPVCGDPRYGGSRCGTELGLDRQFLHAARLRFDHPVLGTAVDVSSRLPPDLAAALEAARAGTASRPRSPS
jgi:23S rRNA pseudouridine1911/1915/1917 synthase